MIERKIDAYLDIINEKHYEPKKHPRMGRLQRAAQFSPFAALNGYEDSIAEEERITFEQLELSEDDKAKINEVIINLKKEDEVDVTYFVSDDKKNGGEYLNSKKIFKKIENNKIFFTDKTSIEINNIIEIEKTLEI